MADAGAAITVAIVDDQALFRAGIRMLVESQPDMAVSWEAGDGAQAAAFAAERCPDVMLMDLRMPVLDGVAPHSGSCSRRKPRAPERRRLSP